MPRVIEIHFDEQNEVLAIAADPDELYGHPVFAAYLRSVDATRGSDQVTFHTTKDELPKRLENIQKLAKRTKFEISGIESEGLLGRVHQERRAFEEFAAEAEAIWNDQFDPKKLQEFAEAVKSLCPGRTLYPRQLLSAFHLAFSQNACNFSVPGAGKTTVVLAAYAYLKSLPSDDVRKVDHLMVVGPLSSFKAWEDEFQSLFLHAPKSKRISGAISQFDKAAYLRSLEYTELDTEVSLTTYSSLASNLGEFVGFVGSSQRKVMLVLDEAHYIKRTDGVWSNAALQLAPLSVSRVALTGTPAPNGYEDLKNLFRFIYPNRDLVGFPVAALKNMTEGANPGGVETLTRKIKPFYTRIRKSDLGLPAAEDHLVEIEMSANHERIYRAIENVIVPLLEQDHTGSIGTSSLVRARMMRLRQAAVNPSLLLRPLTDEGMLDLFSDGNFTISELEIARLVKDFRPHTDLNRLNAVKQLVQDLVGERGKVLIWSYFLGNLDLLKSELSLAAEFVEVITGATPTNGDDWDDEDIDSAETREKIIDRFHRAGESSILIANPQAVGESISLHKACRTSIYFDRDFNAGKFIQSKDRIHRYNPNPIGEVDHFFLQSPGTIDATIARRLFEKEQRLASLVDSEAIPLFSLIDGDSARAQDIAAIIEDYEQRKS